MPNVGVRIDVATHHEVKKLAAVMGATTGDTVALAVGRLRQDRIAGAVRVDLTSEEKVWLDASPSVVHVQVRDVVALILDLPG